MDFLKLLLYFADYLITLPAAFMCVLPVLEHSKIKKIPTVIIVSAAAAVTSIPMAFIRYKTNVGANIPLFAAMVLFFIAYLLMFDVKRSTLWYLFISTTALFSFRSGNVLC